VRRLAILPVLVLAIVAAACTDDNGGGSGDAKGNAGELPAAYRDYHSDLYADDANWLCKPGIDKNVCDRDLDATRVARDGTVEVEQHEAAADPPIDCFYFYPTISTDESPNSDLVPADDAEIFVTYSQAARFNSECRIFAPLYRQRTLGALGGSVAVADEEEVREKAYADVLDAFRSYVAEESDGRGFVLLGHSQGARMVTQLIAEEIDPEPALRDRLVSALVLGSAVRVPEGAVVGGEFANVPLCTARDENRCVVAYSSFRVDAPPPDSSRFGRPREGEGRAACVNPADLAGGPAMLHPYFRSPSGPSGIQLSPQEGFADAAGGPPIETPWITFPDFLEAQCVDRGEFTYLAVTVHSDPADPRVDDIGGDITPEWGLHAIDVNLALGDLVDLVHDQAEAYTS
jgi:pimeloyl-ACP methyl ester carboxylesterase